MTRVRIDWRNVINGGNHYTIAGTLMLLFQFIKLVPPALYKNFLKLENGLTIHF